MQCFLFHESAYCQRLILTLNAQLVIWRLYAPCESYFPFTSSLSVYLCEFVVMHGLLLVMLFILYNQLLDVCICVRSFMFAQLITVILYFNMRLCISHNHLLVNYLFEVIYVVHYYWLSVFMYWNKCYTINYWLSVLTWGYVFYTIDHWLSVFVWSYLFCTINYWLSVFMYCNLCYTINYLLSVFARGYVFCHKQLLVVSIYVL